MTALPPPPSGAFRGVSHCGEKVMQSLMNELLLTVTNQSNHTQ